MHRTNLKSGCTSFLPTLITSADEDMKQAIQAQRTYQQQYQHQSLGIHFEGPYINVLKKGIHRPDFIRPATNEMINILCEKHRCYN